jgi:aldehyde:ferredoxin oxidoreductase
MKQWMRVNLSDLEVYVEELPEAFRLLGGRGLTSRVVADQVPPRCHALEPDNRLIFAPGLLAGTKASSCSRLSIGAKSPLTGTIKESNAGGVSAAKLARLGLRAIVVEGSAPTDELYVLHVAAQSQSLLTAPELRGMGVYDATDVLRRRYPRAAIICIGPAGEMRMAAAGIATTDMDGVPSRFAGRGGLGAVMGSKSLKAIVIDDAGTRPVTPADPGAKQRFNAAAKVLVEAIRNDPVCRGSLSVFGTNGAVMGIQALGGLPTRSFQTGQFEGAERVSGDALAALVSRRGGKGKMGHPCYPGCAIRCSNVVPDEEGEPIVAPLEYETVWALGPNCAIDSLDAIARLNWLCNDIGLDTVEMGNAIGVVMDAGVMPFGDVDAAMELLEEVRLGTPLGRIIGQGAAIAARVYGISRVSAVKGQSMPAYDPRAIKGIGVVFATSTQGADHTIGYTVDPEVWKVGGDWDPASPEGKAGLAREWMIQAAAWDTIGACNFLSYATTSSPRGYQALMEMLGIVTGEEWTAERMHGLGQDVLRIERDFNRRAGFTASDDRLPAFFTTAPLSPFDGVFDVPDSELDSVYDFCESRTGDMW